MRDSLCGSQHATGGETRGTPRARAYKSVRIQRHLSGLRSSISPGEPGKKCGGMDPPQRLLGRFHGVDRNDSLEQTSSLKHGLDRNEPLGTLGMLGRCLMIAEARITQQPDFDHRGCHAHDANTEALTSRRHC